MWDYYAEYARIIWKFITYFTTVEDENMPKDDDVYQVAYSLWNALSIDKCLKWKDLRRYAK